MNAAFHIDHLGFSYVESNGEDRCIFDDLEFKILPGCVTAIMGFSGSGKSTLGKLMAGELKPHKGSVRLGVGLDRELNRFYVDQDPAKVYFPWKTVAGNLRQPLALLGWSNSEIRQRVHELLEEMDLAALAGRFPAFLSGGQKSRLALARVLSWRPRSLILDEYLANLDVVTRDRVVKALRNYVQNHKMTVVIISHNPADVALLADRCVVIGGSPAHVVADIDLVAKRDGNAGDFQEMIYQSLMGRMTAV
jgi:ABC-type nitrate/sulfonate/bicarbonate transport system ATPase subunit